MELIKMWHPDSKGMEPIQVPPADVEFKKSQGWTTEDPARPGPVPVWQNEPVKEIKPKGFTREELEKMKMKELREIGKPFGVNDTSRDELVYEIIAAQNNQAAK